MNFNPALFVTRRATAWLRQGRCLLWCLVLAAGVTIAHDVGALCNTNDCTGSWQEIPICPPSPDVCAGLTGDGLFDCCCTTPDGGCCEYQCQLLYCGDGRAECDHGYKTIGPGEKISMGACNDGRCM